MLLNDLATELIAHIYLSLGSLDDVFNLACTNQRLYHVFASSRKLSILSAALEGEVGPMEDAIQLVTHNASQPAHMKRIVPLSLALLGQVVRVGRVAKAWQDLYPFKKWKENPEDRRLLNSQEQRVFRRALYRIWLYGRAFHNQAHPRQTRTYAPVARERAELLHNWNNEELAEIEDARRIIREVVRNKICPSNGTIQRKVRKRFPETTHQLCFNIHLNYPLAAPVQQFQRQASPDVSYKYRPSPFHEPGFEGWGDDIQHYYVVEDMLKLDPAQVLWLRNNAPLKFQVESYVRGLGGDWFDNNGETLGETMHGVLAARGEDVDEFLADVDDGIAGVIKV